MKSLAHECGTLTCGALLGWLLRQRPSVGEEIVSATIWPIACDLGENVGDVCSRVNTRGFCTRDEGQHVGKSYGACVRTGKEPSFSSGSDAAQVAFCESVVDLVSRPQFLPSSALLPSLPRLPSLLPEASGPGISTPNTVNLLNGNRVVSSAGSPSHNQCQSLGQKNDH